MKEKIPFGDQVMHTVMRDHKYSHDYMINKRRDVSLEKIK